MDSNDLETTEAPPGHENQYLKTARAARREHDSFRCRRILVRQYAWAIPNDAAIKMINKYGPIIEIGAGLGYWASLLEDVVAFDTFAEDDMHYLGGDRTGSWFDVQEGGKEKLDLHPNRTLLLCWPPYDTPMGGDVLRAYRGDVLIHVGEWEGGCTGGAGYWEQIHDEWEDIATVDIPQWYGINDYLTVFKRKV